MALLEDVYLPFRQYSNFDRSCKWRSTMRPGVLYPCLFERVVPGTMVNMSARSILQTVQLEAPLMGSFQLQIDTFWVPLSLYNLDLRLDSNGFDRDMQLPYLPLPTSTATGINATSNNCLLSYLGVPPYYFNPTINEDKINGVGVLAYFDIFRHYYANQQEDMFYCYTTTLAEVTPSASSPKQFQLSKLNDAFETFLRNTSTGTQNNVLNFLANVGLTGTNTVSLGTYMANDAALLLLRCYHSDMNTSWLSSDTYESINTITKVDTSSGSFTMNQLLIADKLFDSYNAEMVSGTHYSDFMKGQYAVRLETRSSKPTLLMSNYSDLWFETIVSSASAQTSDGSYQPLGELGGRGQGKLNGDRVSFVADEPGYIMSIVSIIPRVDYYQGVKPLLYDLNFSDFYNPNFDNIGFQSLPLSQVWGYPAAFSTGSDSTDYTFNSTSASNYFGISGSFSCINEAPLSNAHSLAIGYQPAWTDYMSNVSTIHGDFVDTLRYWTLGRNFMSSSTDSGQTYYTANTSAYIDPSLYNFAFADTANYADNFFTQIAFNLKFNSPISKRVMPHL